MPDELVIVPSDGDGYVELARTKQGRLFRKHILNKGALRHPTTGSTITIDDTFVDTLKTNFANGVCDIVQVPLANDKNEHTEDPTRNIGEVIGIEATADKVYALIDARDADAAGKLGKTLLGASAMMHLDYTDTKTGEKVGPTLLHTCVTNRPYVTGLEDYQEIVAASSDSSHGAVLLTTDVIEVAAVDDTKPVEETTDMGDESKTAQPTATPSLEDLLTTLKNDHNIDVTALQAAAAQADQAATLSKTLVDALTNAGVVKLSNEEKETVSTETVVGAVATLAENNVALTSRVQKLERQDAEHAVQTLIDAGRILPAEKEARVELKLTSPAMFDRLLPAEPIVKLNNASGVTPPEDTAHVKDIDAEVARLSALLKENAK